jgi:hypothetical protein
MAPRWIDHVDHPCTLDEHHAHEALGSSGLRRYLSDEQPTAKTGHLGSAVGWLATTPEARWSEPGALVVQRQNLNGYPGGVEGWRRDNPGVIGLPRAEYGLATAMATALQADPYLARLLASPSVQIEHTVLARHARTGVLAKARPDLRVPGVWLGDLKTTSSTDLIAFACQIGDYGYDAQAALYEAIEASRYGLPTLRCGYDLIVVSRDAPHRVAVVPIAGPWMERGRRMVELCCDLRRLHETTGDRPPLWWEGRLTAADVPPPSRNDREREKRIHEHVRRLHDRSDAQRRTTGTDS